MAEAAADLALGIESEGADAQAALEVTDGEAKAEAGAGGLVGEVAAEADGLWAWIEAAAQCGAEAARGDEALFVGLARGDAQILKAKGKVGFVVLDEGLMTAAKTLHVAQASLRHSA